MVIVYSLSLPSPQKREPNQSERPLAGKIQPCPDLELSVYKFPKDMVLFTTKFFDEDAEHSQPPAGWSTLPITASTLSIPRVISENLPQVTPLACVNIGLMDRTYLPWVRLRAGSADSRTVHPA